MTILTLTAQQDHLEKVARTRDPIKAIAEFVWNGLDANATSVEVSFSFNGLGGIDSISVVDDGDGISRLRADTDFANLGDSWKKAAPRGRSQRALHGKEGRGRLRFFSLAQRAMWDSTFDVDGKLADLSIAIEAATLGKSTVSGRISLQGLGSLVRQPARGGSIGGPGERGSQRWRPGPHRCGRPIVRRRCGDGDEKSGRRHHQPHVHAGR
jgi:hypothetical protein